MVMMMIMYRTAALEQPNTQTQGIGMCDCMWFGERKS
jgi:hypothetical protein